MIKHQIKGTANQMVVCQIDQGQTVYCEAGKLLWKTANVGVETRFSTPETEEANKEKTSFQKLVAGTKEVGKRALAGESIAFQYFTSQGGSGIVAFAGTLPGEVREIPEMLPGLYIEHLNRMVAQCGDEKPLALQIGREVIDPAFNFRQLNPACQR